MLTHTYIISLISLSLCRINLSVSLYSILNFPLYIMVLIFIIAIILHILFYHNNRFSECPPILLFFLNSFPPALTFPLYYMLVFSVVIHPHCPSANVTARASSNTTGGNIQIITSVVFISVSISPRFSITKLSPQCAAHLGDQIFFLINTNNTNNTNKK